MSSLIGSLVIKVSLRKGADCILFCKMQTGTVYPVSSIVLLYRLCFYTNRREMILRTEVLNVYGVMAQLKSDGQNRCGTVNIYSIYCSYARITSFFAASCVFFFFFFLYSTDNGTVHRMRFLRL